MVHSFRCLLELIDGSGANQIDSTNRKMMKTCPFRQKFYEHEIENCNGKKAVVSFRYKDYPGSVGLISWEIFFFSRFLLRNKTVSWVPKSRHLLNFIANVSTVLFHFPFPFHSNSYSMVFPSFSAFGDFPLIVLKTKGLCDCRVWKGF